MKKVVIGLVILLLLCCCCSVIIGLGLLFTSSTGYVDFNGQCLHKGMDAKPTTGPCATVIAPITEPTPTSNSGLTQYSTGRFSDEFTFSYPKNFTLDDSSASITYVYSQDPKSSTTGEFNDNLNITSAASSFDANQTNCDSYKTGLLDALPVEISVNKSSVKTNTTSINGFDACTVTYDATYKGFNLKQEQYVIPDAYFDTTYILTVSLKKDSDNSGDFTSIVNSFQIY